MALDVPMPRLSDSMEEGTILRWLKAPGDAVAVGDELAEIETDKATMAYEADAAGTLLEILVAEGASAPLGAPIARIGAPGETNGGGRLPTRAQASPVARRLAAQLGVELAQLAGSGPNGRIVKADVTAAAAIAPVAPTAAVSVAPAPATVEPAGKGALTRVELTRVQQTIARRMAEAKSTQPDFVLRVEADMEEAVALRARLRTLAADADRPAPSFNDLVVRACALALREHPRAYRDGAFELYERVNVGVAVAAEDALLVPVVEDADRKSLGEIAGETRALAEAARAGTLTAAQLSGGTFTVSNLGMFGIAGFTAVLNAPQAAILAVGALERRAVVHDGELAARHRVELSLTCDHRILYGADAAAFLARIRALLEQPLALAL